MEINNEEYQVWLNNLDLKTLENLLNLFDESESKMNNIMTIDSEKTLYLTKGYLTCISDYKKNINSIITIKKIGIVNFLNEYNNNNN